MLTTTGRIDPAIHPVGRHSSGDTPNYNLSPDAHIHLGVLPCKCGTTLYDKDFIKRGCQNYLLLAVAK
jgi:hypothetical protein